MKYDKTKHAKLVITLDQITVHLVPLDERTISVVDESGCQMFYTSEGVLNTVELAKQIAECYEAKELSSTPGEIVQDEV